jgi:hypothetical protein
MDRSLEYRTDLYAFTRAATGEHIIAASGLREDPMAYLMAIPVAPGGDDILEVEVDRRDVPQGLVLAAQEPGKIAARAQISLEEALAKLKPSLQKIAHLLKELSPEETEVEFGLKLGGETGVIVAKGTAEVNFTVRMTWKAGPRPAPERA